MHWIRDALLPADVLGGTTAAAVTIQPAPEKQLSAQFLDGHTENVTDGPAFRAGLQRLITDEETARGLSGIAIDHPALFERIFSSTSRAQTWRTAGMRSLQESR